MDGQNDKSVSMHNALQCLLPISNFRVWFQNTNPF